MNADESINLDAFRQEIERLLAGGVHGLFPVGTNGEAYILSATEKLDLIGTAVDQVKGRVPVYAGTGCVSTAETVKLSMEAEKLGADVLSIITPYFAAASQKELYDHYCEVAKHVNIPIVLYNIPPRTGNKLLPETVAKLARDVDVVMGAKDSSGDLENLKAYIRQTRDVGKKFSVLAGNDGAILTCLKEGGSGGIAGRANLYPKTVASIYNYFMAGDLKKAQEMQDAVATLQRVFKFGNPNTVIKKGTAMLGHPVGDCRRPFNYLCEEGIAELKAVLKENADKGLFGSTVQTAGQTAIITCDPDTLGKYLENAAAGSEVASVYAGGLSEVSTKLIVQNVEQMAQKDMVLTIKTPDAVISIPTNAMPLPTMSAEAAATTPVTVTVSKSEVSVPGQIGSAISYTLTVGEGDSATEITRFTGPVTHSVSLSAAQTQQVATAVLVGEDGQIIRSVPTNVQTGSGKVVYTSFTNSTYALISNTVSFSDTADKWYADVANEMGSRKIINGSNGSFSGERAVTRAEFVSILVRALGLPQDGTAQFSDVPTTAYYSGAVASAVECGITSGTGNGKFSPNSLISREQAAVMLTRAAALAGFSGRSGNVDSSAFSDYGAISSYAKDSYDFCLNNSISVYSGSKLNSKANVSRGECAVLTLRLMQASGLVDTRATVANPAQETVAEVPVAKPTTTPSTTVTPSTTTKPTTAPSTTTKPTTPTTPTTTAKPSTSSGTANSSIPNYRSDTEHTYLWSALDKLSDPVRKLRLLLQDLNASDVTWNNRNDMRKHAMHARLLIYYGQSLTAEQMITLTSTQRSQMQQYIKGYCTMAGISEMKVF